MKVYVQGLSALAYYRTGGAKTDVEHCSARVRELGDASSSRTTCAEVGVWRLGIGEPSPERPLEVLVRSKGQRSRSKAVVARVWSGPIATTAFRKVSKDLYVSSPEFVFLQMASRLELPELVALGMELCGSYRRNVEVPVLGTNKVGHITVYQQQPLSTPRRLRGLLDSMPTAPGSTKARKALEYLRPNSASPIETAIYLLLCLPRRLGGYALPKPTLNPPIVLSKAGRRHTLRGSAKPDLYWKTVRLDLEYNSREFHDEAQRAIDSMRRKALESMQVEVIELTRDELFSVELFHQTALRIARRLGKQIRPETEGDFAKRRADLRRRLLTDGFPDESASEASFLRLAAESRGAGGGARQDAGFIDFDSSWSAEVQEWNEDGLYVFGGRAAS